MTKKHFNFLADALVHGTPLTSEQYDAFVLAVAQVCSDVNPAFRFADSRNVTQLKDNGNVETYNYHCGAGGTGYAGTGRPKQCSSLCRRQ